MKRWEQILGRQPAPQTTSSARGSFQDWMDLVTNPLLQTSWGKVSDEELTQNVWSAYKQNGPTFALVLARMQVFSQARFQWTRFSGGRPADLFGTEALQLLERPWPGGTTADLLARMELHASTAGNAFVRRTTRTRLNMLRPEWVTIVLGSNEDVDHPGEAADVEVVGYLYKPGGHGSSERTIALDPHEVAHYAPLPDPDNNFLGMSWITPVITEVQADDASELHKRKFFQNAAPQPLDAKVLTPAGWSTMGALQLGDQVIGVDGKPHDVVGVYPQGVQDIYRVTFTDGSSTECTGDHVWRVASAYDRKHGTHRVMSLDEIVAGGLRYPSGPAKWSVPLVEPVQYSDPVDLPVAPYLMGLLLGDGSFRSNGRGSGGVTLAAAADDADQTQVEVEKLLPAGVTVTRRDRGGWSELYFRGRGGPAENPLTRKIRDLGLYDVLGHDKFVPSVYLMASVRDRVDLLQGLIDSDGSVEKDQGNVVRFTSTSEQLVRDLVDLVGGLGGTSTVSPTLRSGRPQWTVLIKRLPDWITPCRLTRKAQRYVPISRGGRYRYIDRVEFVGRKDAQCIRVDSDDHLYVTDDHIVTHNTPNFAIKFDPQVTMDQIREFKELIEAEHRGAWNAYKTLYLGGGADPVVLGKDFKEIDFAATQGKGESRLASAAGVPPSWVGFSEGLQGSALNAGNFTAARRRFADGTLHHLWANAAASLEVLLPRPDSGAHLWYDTRSIPFLREDSKDAAEIQAKEAVTITQLVKEGFTAESAVRAVREQDWSLLVHTGLVSVQLRPPGEADASSTANGDSDG